MGVRRDDVEQVTAPSTVPRRSPGAPQAAVRQIHDSNSDQISRTPLRRFAYWPGAAGPSRSMSRVAPSRMH